MTIKRMYAEISKIEAQDDGTLKVYGYASSGARDSDDEIILPEAMKAALPDYMRFGAVREMHQAKAAGTAIEANVDADGKTWFGAHVVDPIAVKKVETGTYKGFSIGGKILERDIADKRIIKALDLIEVSLVDRPANPESIFTMYKSEKLQDEDAVSEIAKLLDAGTLRPGILLDLAKARLVEDETKKSMYDIAQFAQVLQMIGCLAANAGAESTEEGDNSKLPGALRDWLKQGSEIFNSMAAEETAEMIAYLESAAGVPNEEMLEASASTEMRKAGAKYSAGTRAALGEVHKMIKSCDAAMGGLGYEHDGEDDGEKAAVVDMQKAHGDFIKTIGDLTTERDVLAKRVSDLEKLPAHGKAFLKAISKTEDIDGGAANEFAKADLPLPESASLQQRQDAALESIKKVFSTGGRSLLTGN